jgi:hypothetical protein
MPGGVESVHSEPPIHRRPKYSGGSITLESPSEAAAILQTGFGPSTLSRHPYAAVVKPREHPPVSRTPITERGGRRPAIVAAAATQRKAPSWSC